MGFTGGEGSVTDVRGQAGRGKGFFVSPFLRLTSSVTSLSPSPPFSVRPLPPKMMSVYTQEE